MEKLSTITLTILIFLTVCLLVLGIYGLALLAEQNAWMGILLIALIAFILSYITAGIFKSY